MLTKDNIEEDIDSFNTTEFIYIFLPFESINAELIRRSPLVDQLKIEF